MADTTSRIVRPSAVLKALGLLLLVAAALKTHQLATEPVPGTGLLDARWFLVLWVEVEIVLGVWLLSGIAPRLAWIAALLSFAAFSVVTFGKAVAGEASCGCFGVVEVNPWYTLALDVAAVAALVLWRPALREPARAAASRRRLVACGLVVLAAGVPAGLAAGLYEPARLGDDGRIAGEARFVVLEPGRWPGKALPLLSHIDVADRLREGRWTVVLYHHDCPHCRERVPEWEAEARQRASELGDCRVAMIELPPYAPEGLDLVPKDSPCLRGRVSDERDWFVETPTTFMMAGGTVLAGAPSGPGALAAAGRPKADEAEVPPDASPAAPDEAHVALIDGTYDFGYVRPESTHRILLDVPHTAAANARVTAVRSECKCMSGAALAEALEPGRSLMLRAVLVAPKKPLHYDKRLLVEAKGPGGETIQVPVRIRADVGIPLAVVPSPVEAPAGRAEMPIVVRNRSDRPVRLLYSTSSGSGCFVRVPREPVPAMGQLEVPLVLGSGGARTVSVRIHTDLDIQPTLAVSVRVFAAPGPLARAADPGRSEP